MSEKVICSRCGKECVPDGVGTGYGIVPDTQEKVCYSCCGKMDERTLMNLKFGEKTVLYLSENKNGDWYVTNWPGTLKFKVWAKEGHHNIARVRRDVWFTMRGHYFHGTQYGNNSELCYIKRVKSW